MYQWARQRGRSQRFLLSTGRVNQRNVARAMSFDPGHFSRILAGQAPPTERLNEALQSLLNYPRRSDLEVALEEAPEAPPDAYLSK